MNWLRDCVVIIPCLNEAETIGKLVRTVCMLLPKVIVVDDGSSDGTATEAGLAGAEILRHSINQGKGNAMQSGFKLARSRGFTWALTLDGDGQHDPADIPALLARADESDSALVVGNRMNAAVTMPWPRRFVNRWMSRRLSQIAGKPLADSQCGLRLVNLDVWATLHLRTRHFEFESELLVEFVKAGHKVEFVPVRTIYNSGHSHIQPLLDSWRWFRWWLEQSYAKTSRHPASSAWFSGRLPRLQHNSRSVRQFHLHTTQAGVECEPVQFRQTKPALD